MNIVFEKICKLLNDAAIKFNVLHHQPTFTSEESARVRGEALETGAKALLLKTDDVFSLFIISASKKIDSKKIKSVVVAKKIRFATPDELMELTGLVPGSVPPFGHPVLPFPLYIDESIMRLKRIAFNAGSLETSIIMLSNDYMNAANGITCDICAP